MSMSMRPPSPFVTTLAVMAFVAVMYPIAQQPEDDCGARPTGVFQLRERESVSSDCSWMPR
ncbi:hypothetical protein LX36DRAFT_653636 [Colletotrichum falcatum]|nr:hypothetical protein LX36DRAFT_653636 [Colletotrichum falcatum]